MQKIILVTGLTDGIGLETAKMRISQGHHVLLHGRNPSKDEGQFSQPHRDAIDPRKSRGLLSVIETVLANAVQ